MQCQQQRQMSKLTGVQDVIIITMAEGQEVKPSMEQKSPIH